MRILGFSELWPKLGRGEFFTTFRFPRKDNRDLAVGERVQIVLKPRSPKRQVLGEAEITSVQARYLALVTEKEARQDGFTGWRAFLDWMVKAYGQDGMRKPMNKLTLRWVKREVRNE